MSARLIAELERKGAQARELSAGYKLGGERNLAGLANAVSVALANAVEAINALDEAEGEAQKRSREA